MEIIYLSKNFCVINKPVGVPSQSDTTGDNDAMTMTATELRGRVEADSLWLVHRLDRVVGGLMVFARNKKSAADLSSIIQNGKFQKEYLAVVEGKVSDSGEMRDCLYKDARLSKAFVIDGLRAGAKEAVLEYSRAGLCEMDGKFLSLVRIQLKTGRYHQIRAQFSSRQMPLVGDGKYGSRDKNANTPALISCRISFKSLGEFVDVKIEPDREKYPWRLFND